jgi:hypothetical protein
MPVAETLLTVGALAGKQALKRVVDSTYSSVSEKAQKFLKKLRNDKEISQVYTQLSRVRKVKTIGQLDKAVDLMTFYCPSHIYIEGKRKRITTLDDFKTDENILIEGIAGQGKSIFLRYLSSVEMVRGNVIPVFVELRLIGDGQSLLARIIAALKEFKLDIDAETFSDLANSGKLLLLLDAFDEIGDEFRARVLFEIDTLRRKHEKLRIVATSRPDSGIAACPQFHVVRLSDLEGNEFEAVIHKLLDEGGLATQLIRQVQQHKGGIRELLITPLLVTLLVIRYKSFQELPEQLSDFYDSLFQLLLQRHDGVKPGYKRPRKCAINDYQYRQGFEALCSLAKKHQGGKLDHATIYSISENALKDASITADADHFLNDIVKITCLIVKDGEEYRFIHRSVQEYYAASYIRRKPDVVVQNLYPKIFAEPRCWRFEQELHFLSEIDPYRYHKFCVLPYLRNLFSAQDSDFLESPSQKHFAIVKDRLLHALVHFHLEEGKYCARSFELVRFGVLLSLRLIQEYDNPLFHELIKLKFDKDLVEVEKWPMGLSSKSPRLSLREIFTKISMPGAIKGLEESIVKTTEKLFEIGRKSFAQIESAEKADNVFDLS